VKIRKDHARFREIVRGKIRKNLKKYISSDELIGRHGKETVSIPIPQIDIPRFRFGSEETGGVGQGQGEEGDPLSQNGEPGDGAGQAGSDEGQHVVEVDIKLEELAEMLGEELELPRVEPKGQEAIETLKNKYTGIRPVGPEGLRSFKRTYRRALLRQIASDTYNPDNPIIIPIRDDRRYRSFQVESQPRSKAVIIYMMDVSGSMGDEQKEIVRIESFWIDTWLRSQYKGIESRYIIHDAASREVDRDTFFSTKESGGTMISSAYKLCIDIIEKDYPPGEWNIYPYHFSDGDNWSSDDTKTCIELLEERVIPFTNVFSYGQVESPYGSGQFIKDLREHFGENEDVITSEIKNKEAIMQSIKDFLGKGK
jgi:uncharacterized sporulation protein YeaH/YhbH (DUF444 family)